MNEDIIELGSLDINIYNCISPQINTDRVIITNKQLEHILDHHPEAYHEALIELKSTLANSIISGWKISEKRLKNYLKHKTILYKKT